MRFDVLPRTPEIITHQDQLTPVNTHPVVFQDRCLTRLRRRYRCAGFQKALSAERWSCLISRTHDIHATEASFGRREVRAAGHPAGLLRPNRARRRRLEVRGHYESAISDLDWPLCPRRRTHLHSAIGGLDRHDGVCVEVPDATQSLSWRRSLRSFSPLATWQPDGVRPTRRPALWQRQGKSNPPVRASGHFLFLAVHSKSLEWSPFVKY
jgi:hypothetical protein